MVTIYTMPTIISMGNHSSLHNPLSNEHGPSRICKDCVIRICVPAKCFGK